MFLRILVYSLILLWITSCGPPSSPVLAPPPPPEIRKATLPEEQKPVLAGPPETFRLSPAIRVMVVEAEGFVSKPEAPDARYSGVSWGIGYDGHTNSVQNILGDWAALPPRARLAAMHPYYGRAAQQHVREVADIRVPRGLSDQVFDAVDVPRTRLECARAFPKFEALHIDARSVLISLVFNRGAGMTGDSRREMRAIRDLVPKRDYVAMAGQIRAMERVWAGTDIERGMRNRREAEARIMEKCR